MEFIIHDAIFVERKVEVPEKCPNPECGVSFTKGANLLEWDWNDRSFFGDMSPGGPGGAGVFGVNDSHDGGDVFKPCDLWCHACGKQVVNGGAIVTVAHDEPLILNETIAQRLREARGEE